MIVKVCGAIYRLFKYRKAPKWAKTKSIPDPIGACDYNHTRMWIDPTKGSERQYRLFIHESIHGLHYETGTWKYFKNKKQEEEYVELLELALAAYIRDNIKILKQMGRF